MNIIETLLIHIYSTKDLRSRVSYNLLINVKIEQMCVKNNPI